MVFVILVTFRNVFDTFLLSFLLLDLDSCCLGLWEGTGWGRGRKKENPGSAPKCNGSFLDPSPIRVSWKCDWYRFWVILLTETQKGKQTGAKADRQQYKERILVRQANRTEQESGRWANYGLESWLWGHWSGRLVGHWAERWLGLKYHK